MTGSVEYINFLESVIVDKQGSKLIQNLNYSRTSQPICDSHPSIDMNFKNQMFILCLSNTEKTGPVQNSSLPPQSKISLTMINQS